MTSFVLKDDLGVSFPITLVSNGDGTFSPSTPNSTLTPIPGVTNFDPALLPHARAAFAKVRANTGRAKVMFVGDSTTMGYGGASDGITSAKFNSFPNVAGKLLASLGLPTNGTAQFSNNAASSALYNPELVYTGWGNAGSGTVGGDLWSNSVNTNPLSLTPNVAVDTFDVYYSGGTTGQFTVDVDGAGAITVSVTSPYNLLKQTITAVGGTHTVNIKRVSGSVYIAGIDGYSTSNYAVSIWNAGWAGSKSSDWNSTLIGASPVSAIPVYAPDLTFIALGINDEAAGVPYKTYYANIQAVITAAKQTGDVILVFHHDCSNHAVTEQVTLTALQALSVANNVPLVNFMQRLGSYTQANALGEMYDTMHPNAVGYADEAVMIADLLRRI